ncbi:hypothetical protein, partial [Immundisolibacter sp.]|uniref:hypothetical protein n=1 Tax=Immundisolibacter sp. TaxID=1934948 RepID=UPI0035679779
AGWRLTPFLAHSPGMPPRLTIHLSQLDAAPLAAELGLDPSPPSVPTREPFTAYLPAFALFGWSTDVAPPLAAVTYAHDFGTPPPAWCSRLDPVCLQPAGASLRLLSLDATPLTPTQARALFERVSCADIIQGVSWHMATPLRWYVLSNEAPMLETSPPDSLPGGRVADGQPSGPDAPRWQAWLNELQMLLFDAPPNLAREALDQAPANALWLWGSGVTPTLGPSPFSRVWTEQPLIGGLSRLAGVTPEPVPASGTQLLDALATEHGLLDLAVNTTADDLHERWLRPLRRALDGKQLASLHLHVTGPAGNAVFDVQRRGLLSRVLYGAWRTR